MKLVNGIEVFSGIEEILDPRHTALLIVDVQNDCCLPEGWFARHGKDVSRMPGIFPKVASVLETARRTGMLRVFMEQTTLPDGLSDSPAWLYFKTRDGRTETDYTLDGSWGQRTIGLLAPQPGEVVIKKHRPSAFFGTNLDIVLSSRGIKSVLVCGTITQGCVLATVLDASFHGFYTVLLADGVQSYNQELHEVAITFLASRYDLVSSAEVTALWDAATRSAGGAQDAG